MAGYLGEAVGPNSLRLPLSPREYNRSSEEASVHGCRSEQPFSAGLFNEGHANEKVCHVLSMCEVLDKRSPDL